MIKVVWFAHRDALNPRAGGAERSISEISSRLSYLGYEITVLSAGWKGCKIRDSFRGFQIQRFSNNIGLHFYVPLYILKNRPDIIVNDLGHAVPWPSSIFLRKKGLVFFRHLHARSLPGQVNRFLALLITAVEKIYYILYHEYIFITESTTSVADLKRIGIKNSKIIRVSPGVNITLYKESEKTKEPTLVYFGGMRKYKRPVDVIGIFEQVQKEVPNTKLILIGSGPELTNVKKMVDSKGIRDSVNFTGRVTDEQLASMVSSSWINLHTSQTEGWGYSILESSASGTPTVAYSVPGVVDAIEDGMNGIKVRDNDIDAFVNAVLKILKDPKPLWESSRKVALKYSWDDTAKKWDEAIRKVIANQ